MRRIKTAVALIIACATITLLLMQPAANAAGATAIDTVGLENGAVYYIKNRHDNRYLSVASNSDVNGTNVCTLNMTQSNTQKWRAVLNSDGTYTLYAVFSTHNRVLHYQTSGSNVILWAYIGSYAPQKFTITRKTTGAYSGLYQIKNGSKYVSLSSSGNNVCATETPTAQTKALWSIVPVAKGDADAYTFITPSRPFMLNTTGVAATFLAKCNSMGYNPYHLLNRMANEAYGELQTDSIFVFLGHGLSESTSHVPIAAIGFSGTEGEEYGNIYAYSSNQYSIHALPNNALRRERIVLYLGCSTGVSYQGHNLVDETFAKGAHFALGTTKTLLGPQIVAWAKSFFTYAAKGKTIADSIYYANYKVSLGNLYFKGDSQATLKY